MDAGPKPAPPYFRRPEGCALLQRVVDRCELCIEGCADAVNRRNNHNRDAGGNQAVFNGGGAGFVIQETCKKLGHVRPSIEEYSTHDSQQLQLS